MDIIGKFIKLLPTQEGDSPRGHWVRGGFVIETEDRYPQKIAFTIMGEDKVRMVQQLQLGAKLQVQFSPESREYNDKWYTELRCYAVQALVSVAVGSQLAQAVTTAQASAQLYGQVQQAQASPVTINDDNNNDLPF